MEGLESHDEMHVYGEDIVLAVAIKLSLRLVLGQV